LWTPHGHPRRDRDCRGPLAVPEDRGVTATEPRPSEAVELTNVSRWYGNVVAVNDISFRLDGGVTGLLGPNGAGKSTILHMIGGFLAPSSGSVTVGGSPSWRHPEMYRRIGL